jgi:hypothetical protein
MATIFSPLPSPAPGLAGTPPPKKTFNVLPFPATGSHSEPVPFGETRSGLGDEPAAMPIRPALPEWPAGTGPVADPGRPWPAPLAVLPVPASQFGNPFIDPWIQEPVTAAAPPAQTPPPASAPVRPPAAATPEPAPDEADFTDDDLRQAFGPIVEHAVRRAVYAQENGIDTYLEPMLRATIRRALAEYSPASRPFQPPGALDRFLWHIQALFTSRTYEDILFEKTRRFQVEEVFLLDAATLALVSFASCDPARHASARRVSNTVSRLAHELRDADGSLRPEFNLPDGRSVVSRRGRHVVLMAVVRGRPGELVDADLNFALRRVEDHFRKQFQQEGSELLYPLQPFLEDCLLIQSPATAA